MFDLGMMELLVIGIVALIVVGPKDLPGMFRTVGNFVGKMKGMAREFQRSMDEAARESGVSEATSGLKELQSSVKSATDFNPLDFDKDHGKTPPKAKSETAEKPAKAEAAEKPAKPKKKPAKPKKKADTAPKAKSE